MEVINNLTEKGQRDYQLIQRALEHQDQQAYAELLKHYRDPLYYMMLKMTGDPDDAEDLTIEAFGKAFKSLKLYTPNYAFSTWLFRIATNNCIDFMRKKAKIGPTVNLDDDEKEYQRVVQIPSGTPNPEEEMIKDQKINTMHEYVSRLKPTYRRLIELRYFKEYSYEEIVDELGLPLGTVKAQLFRAREYLHNMLKEKKEKI
ncbi:MAG: sigma-70 family RNA polymerase sigma factor [Chlorobi bacterium]|nr:sigma-70 family RNA polymerase sigma factor [Chlorobiota bacterium]